MSEKKLENYIVLKVVLENNEYIEEYNLEPCPETIKHKIQRNGPCLTCKADVVEKLDRAYKSLAYIVKNFK